ncbi:response regulator transcription factor [Gaiella sp.]|jgi:DNA-binding NarL/FixJ family response regulator|uniref:response regulator transcription factor n=1 Tax=Gaiella sp. TaxID=2663207 RepID=UPI002E329113|nr:helix-turn-helix transcriptional regulator [Gaiella sp.]HEX5584822.1 helix-turn-helix transcriptional regulator [Gaiella sp.]
MASAPRARSGWSSGRPPAHATPGAGVLAVVAEGKTNAAIAKQLWVTEKTVETHVSSILGKLGLTQAEDSHRRVLAVLAYLRSTAA